MDEKTIRRTIRGLLGEADEFDEEAQKRRVAAAHLEALLPAENGSRGGSNEPRPAANGQPKYATDAILAVIREANSPVDLDAIRAGFKRKGWIVPKSFHESLRRLRLRGEVVRVRNGVYGVAPMRESVTRLIS